MGALEERGKVGRLPGLPALDSDLHRRELFPRSLWSKTTGGPKALCSEAGRAADGGEGGAAGSNIPPTPRPCRESVRNIQHTCGKP